jgi:hypothetical protein
MKNSRLLSIKILSKKNNGFSFRALAKPFGRKAESHLARVMVMTFSKWLSNELGFSGLSLERLVGYFLGAGQGLAIMG